MNGAEVEKLHAEDLKNIKWYGIQAWKPLVEEIYKLMKTLLKLDTDDIDPTVYFADHALRIRNSLPSIPVKQTKQVIAPIHRLLKVGPLGKIEIPLDVLEMLTSAGFDVNSRYNGERCLHISIVSQHYKAVRWLVEHGAEFDNKNRGSDNPMAVLATRTNVPLDLFDLLNSPENLNVKYFLPLHNALACRHTEYALHLIQLGAKIDVNDGYDKKPIDHYIDVYRDEFHEELFLKLIQLHSFILVCEISDIVKDKRHTFEVISQMVMYLLQYLIIPVPDEMPGDGIRKYVAEFHEEKEVEEVYMDSVIVLLLDMDTVTNHDIAHIRSAMPDETCKQSLEDIWNAYNHRHGSVKSLATLCIHSVRNSMNSLDKNNFYSLPVPSRIRDLLMLRNVASILCEAWRIWPKCLPIEDIVNEAL